jgi:hypothetical protein
VSIYDEIMAEIPDRMCRFGEIIAALDPDDKAGLEKALDDPRITQIAIVNVLTKRGLTVDRDTMSRHVRGKCVCFR